MTSPDYAHHFSDRNVPFGIASSARHPEPQAATRLGNFIILLHDCHVGGVFDGVNGLPKGIFAGDTLNGFAALPKGVQSRVREAVQVRYKGGGGGVSGFPAAAVEHVGQVRMHLPVRIGDFADFSCSLAHVQNAGRIIINDERPPPAFYNMPIAYQGRASSVVVSGADIERPLGQFPDRASGQPGTVVFGPSRSVDYEMEFAAVVGRPLAMRQRVAATDADQHIFGFVVLNDWSARDIQGYEMMPLGPFNSKSLGTTISPWVVTLDALEEFKTGGPPPLADVGVPQHLRDPARQTYDVGMKVEIVSGDGATATVAGVSNVRDLYWSPRQMVAHAVSSGAALRTGDILATGTVSGVDEHTRGCMLELTEGGARPFRLRDGSERAFLHDGDVVRMTAVAGDEKSGVGFGECVGRLVGSRPCE